VYGDGVFIGLICDNRLFFKRTEAGGELLGDDPEEAPPYPGAKPTFVMTDEQLEDPDFLSAMARATTRELAP
jgi:TfoX/Sxy family transcriptional regulator of competence genes